MEIDLATGQSQNPGLCARRHEATSAWSVQQQLEHLLLVDRRIITWLHTVADDSVESEGPGGPTMPGRLVVTLGFIPRGRGRAPIPTHPQGMTTEAVEAGFIEIRGRAEALTNHLPALAADQRTRKHPLLGFYTASQWLRFAEVHHRHHRKIIRDILKATH